MSIYTDTDFVPCYKGGRCEDAPCCGCGDDNRYLGEYSGDEDGYDKWADYEDSYDEYDDEPEVDNDGPLWNEDAAMESSLFGDC